MDLTHDFTVPLDVPTAWEAFNDLERIAPCFPGAAITSVDGDDFTGTAKVKLGPISLQYSGTGTFRERDEASRRAVIDASGKDKRGNGTASATITARLEEVAEGTRVVVETDLKITGRPAQFGRGVIADVGGKILDQFAECLSATLGQSETDGAATSTAPPGGSSTSEGDHAAAAPSDGASGAEGAEGARATAAPTGSAAPGAAAAAPPVPAATDPSQAGAAASPQPAAAAATGTPSTPPPRPSAPPSGSAELDLGAVVLPMLARRYGPTLLACAVTAIVTWRVARR